MTGRSYELVVGLEVHAELKTDSKMFCGCSTEFGRDPNSQVCPVCLGMPGVLPVINEGALQQALRAAMALNCKIRRYMRFDRKNYHYPDLPKGYQISQFDLPLGYDGYLEIDAGEGPRRIRIRRVHLEEDTGKSVHDGSVHGSLIDFNRSGVPLLEIVSEPDLRSPEESRAYLTAMRDILAYTGVSDVRMEEGSLRVDTNISVRPPGSKTYGTITEIKNLNSFRSVVRALAYEGDRQWQAVSGGARLQRQTRHWDERRDVTFSSRSKEEAHDYRYFPEPDLVPVVLSEAEISALEKSLPELPAGKRRRFVAELGLSEYDAGVMTADPRLAAYFETCLEHHGDPKAVANWVMTEVLAHVNAGSLTIDQVKTTPEQLAELLKMVDAGTLSGKLAKDVLAVMLDTGNGPAAVAAEQGLRQISDEESLGALVDEVIEEHPGPVSDVRGGKDKALGFLVGQVMKRTRGQANPQVVNQLLRDRLPDAP